MKVSDNFTLEYLHGVPYLLPYGQAVADLQRGLQLNASGVFLWEALRRAPDFDRLLEMAAAQYHADAAEYETLAGDIRHFIRILQTYGILPPDNASSHADLPVRADHAAAAAAAVRTAKAPDCPACRIFQIGGLRIHFYGERTDFSDSFSAFALQCAEKNAPTERPVCPESPAAPKASANPSDAKKTPDLTITVRHEALPKPVTGQLLLRSADLAVYAHASAYTLLFPSFTTIEGAALSTDGSAVTFYCPDPETARNFQSTDPTRRGHGNIGPRSADSRGEELFHAIRFVYLYLAQRHGLFALHSVSILYREKLWLFSGHSGMGKSTHAALWERLYHTPVINGDLNLLSLSAKGAVVQGIPWCGTSGIFDVHTYPLGGIFLLKQGQTDAVSSLSKDKQQLLTMQRFISPSWTKPQLDANLVFAGELAARVPVMRLTCTKNESAATTCKDWIDALLA